MDHPFKIGVVILLQKNGRILLGKRLAKAGFGEWGLPGGHVEFGEKLESAARRELLEETGITADKLEFMNVTNDPRSSEHYIHIVFTFAAENLDQQPQVTEPDKCEQWDWFDLKHLPTPLFFGHKKVLEAIGKNILISD